MKNLFLFLFIFVFASCAKLKQADDDLAANAIHSEISSATLSDLEKEFLKPNVKGKRFVYLGESDHYFEEKFTYRLKFIEYLLSQGFSHILDELGVSDGEMVQRYLETGDEDYLKQVGLYGFQYGKPLGESKRNFVISSKRYMRKLRSLKLKYPSLVYGGFDLDMVPGTAYLQLDDFFSKYQFPFLENFKELVERSKSFEGEEQLKLLKKSYSVFLSLKPKLKIQLGELEFVHFELIFRNFVASIEMRERFLPANYSRKDLDWREKQMFKNMLARFQLDPAEQKYVLLGHNGHLTKTVEQYKNLNGVQQWYAIGSWISDRFPDQVYAIWSLIGRGEHSGHGCEERKTCYFSSPRSTLEYKLLGYEAEKTLLFSTQLPRFLQSKKLVKTYVNGIEILEGPLALQADAIYFIPKVNDVGP